MSLKRFKTINQCIRFDDKEERAEARFRDKLAPIRKVYDKWLNRVKMCYTPGRTVTVDEQLLPFRGRCPFTQYIPSQPHKYGIKLWMACDAATYYAWNVEIYIGRDRNCAPEVNQGERVVLSLTEGLACRNITCDNFFTSYHLAEELQKRKNTIVGTIRKNRKEIPPILLQMKNKPNFHSEFVFEPNVRCTMVSYVPRKNRFVTLLSTMHTTKEVDDTTPALKPEIINFYNSTKGGVDTMDKLVGTYRCKRKVERWPLAVFCNLLDISAVNAFVIFTSLNPTWNYARRKYRRRLFLKELEKSLVYGHIAHRECRPRTQSALSVVNTIQDNPSVGSVHSVASACNLPNSEKLTHASPTRKRARCFKCVYNTSGNLYSSRCDKCKKHVCKMHYFSLCDDCVDKLGLCSHLLNI